METQEKKLSKKSGSKTRQRNHCFHCRLLPDEKTTIVTRASERGISASQDLREAALGTPHRPPKRRISPLHLAILAASRSVIQATVSLAQEIESCKGRILLDDKSTDLARLFATLERKRRLDTFPNARTQLIQLLAYSLAEDTATARKHQPSN